MRQQIDLKTDGGKQSHQWWMTNDDDLYFQQIMAWDSKVVGAKTRLGGILLRLYFITFPPKKALLLSSGKGKLNLFFSFLFYLYLNATLSLTFSSHISKNEWEVKPTPQFDYRRMRTKFYNILWDLGNLKIRGKFCNIFHLKILRIMFLNILYLRHPIHFIILPPMGPLSIYTKARALIKQKTFTMKPFIWSYSFYELVRPGVKWKLARLHLQV